MNYTPKPNRAPAIALTAFVIISSLIFLAFSFLAEGFMSSVMKMTAFVFVMSAALIISRFLTCTHTYTLDSFEFKVTRNMLNKKTTLCRLYYTDIVSINPYKTRGDAQGFLKYNYCTSMLSKDALCLICDCNGDEFAVVIERIGDIEEQLKKRINADIDLD